MADKFENFEDLLTFLQTEGGLFPRLVAFVERVMAEWAKKGLVLEKVEPYRDPEDKPSIWDANQRFKVVGKGNSDFSVSIELPDEVGDVAVCISIIMNDLHWSHEIGISVSYLFIWLDANKDEERWIANHGEGIESNSDGIEWSNHSDLVEVDNDLEGNEDWAFNRAVNFGRLWQRFQGTLPERSPYSIGKEE